MQDAGYVIGLHVVSGVGITQIQIIINKNLFLILYFKIMNRTQVRAVITLHLLNKLPWRYSKVILTQISLIRLEKLD